MTTKRDPREAYTLRKNRLSALDKFEQTNIETPWAPDRAKNVTQLYKCTARVTARPFDFIYFIIKFLGISANLRGADRLHFITFPKNIK